LAFLVFIERVMDSNRVNLRTGSKIDPYQKMNKIHQNPAILNGFHDFVRFW